MNDITIEKSRQSNPADTLKKLECLKLEHGLFIRELTGVVVEKELRIYLNENHLITASITPGMEKEFITGYLFGQGFITGKKELESVHMENNAIYATVGRADDIAGSVQKTGYRVVSGGGRAAYFGETDYPEVGTDLKIDKQAIFTAMNMLFEKAEIYKATEGVHGAGLFTAEAEPICIIEDIGRHNCLDKLIGYALINDIDCSHTLLVSTGRMASEMVAKICRAEIPVAATKTAVTDKGLEIARKCGMTIIGFVRDAGTSINTDMETRTITEAGMKIYTHAERIGNGRK
jgi:FdhD protein